MLPLMVNRGALKFFFISFSLHLISMYLFYPTFTPEKDFFYLYAWSGFSEAGKKKVFSFLDSQNFFLRNVRIKEVVFFSKKMLPFEGLNKHRPEESLSEQNLKFIWPEVKQTFYLSLQPEESLTFRLNFFLNQKRFLFLPALLKRKTFNCEVLVSSLGKVMLVRGLKVFPEAEVFLDIDKRLRKLIFISPSRADTWQKIKVVLQ